MSGYITSKTILIIQFGNKMPGVNWFPPPYPLMIAFNIVTNKVLDSLAKDGVTSIQNLSELGPDSAGKKSQEITCV